jgi:hypothetical protein
VLRATTASTLPNCVRRLALSEAVGALRLTLSIRAKISVKDMRDRLEFISSFGERLRGYYMYVCNSTERKTTHLRTKAMQYVHKQMIHFPPYLAKAIVADPCTTAGHI